jgi:hypothetical protein
VIILKRMAHVTKEKGIGDGEGKYNIHVYLSFEYNIE